MKPTQTLFVCLWLLHATTLPAQVQWYQNQDANNPPPYGTVATSIKPFTPTSFLATYLWSTEGEQNNWKLSKTSTGGAELRSHIISGLSATVECRIIRHNTVYALERSFTPDYMPLYKVYKLDVQLNRVASGEIVLPGGFIIYNLGAFETDEEGNLYFTGDGQYPRTDGSQGAASFVLKWNKHLQQQWRRVDSSETAFTGLHIDRWGRVLVVEDHPSIFPQVRIRRFAFNGQPLPTFNIHTDASRFSLSTTLDQDDNLLLYGGKTVNETAQAIYLKRISRFNGQAVYTRTHFTGTSSQVCDLRVDRNGSIFLLSSFNTDPGQTGYRVSRINLFNGHVAWNRVLLYEEDSCILNRLVVGTDDHLYAIGEKRSHNYFSRGMAVGYKKNGQAGGRIMAPDSVAYQRSHWLSDGMIDNGNRLIAVGSTTDVDTITFSNQYLRSFAVRLGSGRNDHECNDGRNALAETEEEADKESIVATSDGPGPGSKLVVYPNPVQDLLTISRIDTGEFDRLAVFNMQGMQVLQRKITEPVVKLDTRHWTAGVYLLQLRSGNSLKEQTIKFVVSE